MAARLLLRGTVSIAPGLQRAPNLHPPPTSKSTPPPNSAGDRTNNLMWRLMNGELLQKRPPKLVVLLIGESGAGPLCACQRPAPQRAGLQIRPGWDALLAHTCKQPACAQKRALIDNNPLLSQAQTTWVMPTLLTPALGSQAS